MAAVRTVGAELRRNGWFGVSGANTAPYAGP
jgi:hypothetical protein